MAATAVNMARLLGLAQGFSELVQPEVPRTLVRPDAIVTKDNVAQYEEYVFNHPIHPPSACRTTARRGPHAVRLTANS